MVDYNKQANASVATEALEPLARPTRRQLLATLGAAAGAGVAGWLPTSAQAAPTTLQCAGAYTDALFHTQNLQQFAKQAGEGSKGALQINVVTNAKLMPMTEVMPALSKGDLAIGEIFMSNFAQQYPLLGIDSLPFIVRSFDDAKRLWEATRQPIEALLQKQGIRVLYTAPWPGQGLFARAPVNKLEDVKGQKFRVNNDATKFIAQVAGATPVDTAANNLAKAIQSGQVDVMVTSSTTGVDSQSWNAMGIFVDMRAWIPKNLILMSEKHWAKLPEDAKKSLEAASRQAEARGWQLARDADDAAQRVLVEHGTKISQPSYELRRTLDLMGEKFAREWSSKAGVEGASALITYYFPSSKS
ncbi:TRAP-type C4-dicarboxylate transport system substrate-binding protein [Comamonas odontotermitis]|uniref:TRAP-type C4-dicarboxylate transport system substrate-binding protein n=1 Tax=Comamonas odontotermitis TaxID=379895 RepID=A0ABR6RL19_9BURK|nr:TRAP transporter substrate-binding protein [Comamonas odontotermitis]MBB6579881.1 TRAP-type C4-dicarboxylate transport system substrate-binding protein [Comamonas odontotermitis]